VLTLLARRSLFTLCFFALMASACGGSSEVAADDPGGAATSVPATQVPSDAPEPTATDVPEPTATDVPEPTATDVPEPTATEVPEPTATAEPEPSDTEEPSDTDVAPASDGAALFASNCAFCHGAQGGGSDRGPSILGIGEFFQQDATPLTNLVTNGGNKMPEFGSKLTTEDIDAVVQYVVDTFQ